MSTNTPNEDAHDKSLDAVHWRAIIAHTPLCFDVISDSMAPTFRTGEQVMIRPLEDDEPKPGQVLAYYSGMLVTHRYLQDGVCRGDNLFHDDPVAEREQMVGIVSAVKRRGALIPLGSRMPLGSKIQRILKRARRRVERMWPRNTKKLS